MKLSTVIANSVVDDSNEQRAEQALKDWISEHINVCEIDTTNLICPRFIMLCDNIHRYQRAVDAFGALWINFNNVGVSEVTFMSAYCIARKHILEKNE